MNIFNLAAKFRMKIFEVNFVTDVMQSMEFQFEIIFQIPVSTNHE